MYEEQFAILNYEVWEMDTDWFYWTCKNSNCNVVNRISRQYVESAIKNKKLIDLTCPNCGYVNLPEDDWKPVEEESKTWLPCILFTGPEASLTIGTDGVSWKDANGKSYSREEYKKRYYVDPKINFEWRKNGCPHAKKKR